MSIKKHSVIALASIVAISSVLMSLTANAQSTNDPFVDPILNNTAISSDIHHAELCCDPFDSEPQFSNLTLDDALATNLAPPNADQLAAFNGALNSARNHINGSAQLNASELVAVNDALNENISALLSDRESMVNALDLVALYENQHGGFLQEGQQRKMVSENQQVGLSLKI